MSRGVISRIAYGRSSQVTGSLLALLAGIATLTVEVRAGDALSRDIWVGANATDGMWQVYSGATFAPFSTIHSDGWRLRSGGGYGRYSYTGGRRTAPQDFQGSVTYLDAMAGYQVQWGPLTAKGFVGVAAIEHRVTPHDRAAASGREFGPKLQTELWLDTGEGYWASLDASFTTAHDTYAARARVGLRLTPKISIGPELEITDTAVETADLESGYTRGGAFATYSWGSGEISTSSGLAGDLDGDLSPYVTVNFYSQF